MEKQSACGRSCSVPGHKPLFRRERERLKVVSSLGKGEAYYLEKDLITQNDSLVAITQKESVFHNKSREKQ
jgi:hypothetical protein